MCPMEFDTVEYNGPTDSQGPQQNVRNLRISNMLEDTFSFDTLHM